MPTVRFRGDTIECEPGAVLRDVLLDAGVSPHNGRSDSLNCRGHGTCGTCAVGISPPDGEGDPPISAMGGLERRRLSFPPHDPEAGLRLACQTRVEGDVVVEKHSGFWGQHVGADR
jgi:ferredoxin